MGFGSRIDQLLELLSLVVLGCLTLVVTSVVCVSCLSAIGHVVLREGCLGCKNSQAVVL